LSDCRNYLQTIEVVGFRLMHTIHCSRGKDFGRSLKFDREEEIEPCPSLLLDGSCLGAGVMPLDRGVLSVASSEDNAKSRSSCEAPGLVCRSLGEGFAAIDVSMFRQVHEDLFEEAASRMNNSG
jgi:hypothetical protein